MHFCFFTRFKVLKYVHLALLFGFQKEQYCVFILRANIVKFYNFDSSAKALILVFLFLLQARIFVTRINLLFTWPNHNLWSLVHLVSIVRVIIVVNYFQESIILCLTLFNISKLLITQTFPLDYQTSTLIYEIIILILHFFILRNFNNLILSHKAVPL